MTIKQTLAEIRTSCPTISARWIADTKEYRVTLKRAICLSNEDCENKAYYTNDAQDAIDTAKRMHEGWGK